MTLFCSSRNRSPVTLSVFIDWLSVAVYCMPEKIARKTSDQVFQFCLRSLFPRAHMGGLEQAGVFVFPLQHKFGTRAKIWRNTHLVWISVFVILERNQILHSQCRVSGKVQKTKFTKAEHTSRMLNNLRAISFFRVVFRHKIFQYFFHKT